MYLTKIGREMKRMLISLIIVVLVVSCMPLNLITAYGETVPDYDVDKAVAYAEAHYNDGSTATTNQPDCTQFVRECFEAGGVPKDTNRVNAEGPYGYTVDDYILYLQINGYATTFGLPLNTEKQEWSIPQWYVSAAANSSQISVGDGVYYHCNECGTNFHMSIITGVDQDGYLLYHAQNSAVGGARLCLIDCSNCGASREHVFLYSIHIMSDANGYSDIYNNETVSGVKAERISNNQIRITWNAAEDAAGYYVFVKNGANSAFNFCNSTTATSVTYTEPTPGAAYYFAVRPYFYSDATYVGKMSETVYNNEYLVAPTGVNASYDPSTGQATITWDKVPGADRYEVYRATSENGTYAMLYSNTGTRFVTSNMSAGGTYYFKIKAINDDNAAGNSPFSAVVAVTASDLGTPVVSSGIDSQGRIMLTWEYIQGADGYEVYRSNSSTGTFTRLSSQTGNTFYNGSVNPGQVYYYKVRAISNSSSKYTESSTVAQIAKLAQPVVKTTTNNDGKPVLSWSAVRGADRYEVYRAVSADGTYTNISSLTSTSYTDTAASVGSTYYYKVLAASDMDQDANTESQAVNVTCTKPAASIDRYSGNNRYETAFAVADALKEQQGVDKFENIIVAYGDNYADALAGSYLAKVKNAPILVVNSRMESYVKDYIDENTNKAGTIYLLGGEGVVSRNFANSLTSSGYNVKRLGGANRYETNMSILRESGVTNEDILVCSASSFADSLSASAVGKPILLVNTSLYDEQKDLLSTFDTDRFYLIGGTGAVTASVGTELRQYGTVERVAGSNRYTTSKAIADKFFAGGSDTIVIASGDDFPDGLTGGPLAMSLSSPLFLVNDRNTSSAAEYVADHGLDVITVIGGTGVVSDDAANAIAGRK